MVPWETHVPPVAKFRAHETPGYAFHQKTLWFRCFLALLTVLFLPFLFTSMYLGLGDGGDGAEQVVHLPEGGTTGNCMGGSAAGSYFQRYPASWFRAQHLSKASTTLPSASTLALLLQYAVATTPISQIDSHGQLPVGSFSGHRNLFYGVMLLHSLLLSIAPRVRLSLGAYPVPQRDPPSHSI